MGTGFQPLEVEAAPCIGHGVTAVFKVDSNILDASFLGECVLRAVGFEDTTYNRACRTEQVFPEPDQCRRFVGNQTRVRERGRDIDKLLIAFAADYFDNIENSDSLTDTQSTDVEFERARVRP